MKPAAYWEDKLKEATKTICLLEQEVWRVERRAYSTRKLECSYLRRKRKRIAQTKIAGLKQKLNALQQRMDYIYERLAACAQVTRFDRARRLPPI